MENTKDELTYFITAIKIDKDADPAIDKIDYYPYSIRCFGFKKTLEAATKIVEENITDIHECYYNYAVIEGISPGLYPDVDSGIEYRQFYKWDARKNKYIKCDEPDYFKERAEKYNIIIGCYAF